MPSTKALLARAAKFITGIASDTDWRLYSTMFDVDDIAEGITRLYRSQGFGDPDYPGCVHRLFQAIAAKDESLALQFVRYVIKDSIDLEDTKMVATDPELLVALDLIGEEQASLPPLAPASGRLLDVKVLPGDFYIELQEQINKAFAYGIYPAVNVFGRKFLENLLVDILRKKYGMGSVELFYDTGRRRFHGFEILLKNLHDRIDDFAAISPAFDDAFLRKINMFREHGNSSAHTIELKLSKEDLERDVKDLEYAIKLLVRVLDTSTP